MNGKCQSDIIAIIELSGLDFFTSDRMGWGGVSALEMDSARTTGIFRCQCTIKFNKQTRYQCFANRPVFNAFGNDNHIAFMQLNDF